MASLRRKQTSTFWWACFALPNGMRRQRSTKERDRRRAQKIADAWEDAARRTITARQMQKVVTEMYRDIMGEGLPSSTVRGYFDAWLNRKRGETAATTLAFYEGKAARFLAWLGERADGELVRVVQADVLAFRTSEATRVSAATVNHQIKFLRMLFAQARRDGLLAENPAEDVKTLKRIGHSSRRAFTIPELQRLLEGADAEWKSLILFGLYTGQRLGDLSRLTWQNVDLERSEIRLVTSKTGRQQIIWMAESLRRHVESLPAGDDPKEPIHPRAFASVTTSGKVGTLSRQFYELMASVGMVEEKPHRAPKTDAPSRSGRREVSEISFHALRHTATSLLKNAGVSSAIVQDIIGHESAAISANYTHIDDAAKRGALAKLPDILRPAKSGTEAEKPRRDERRK
ncbi:MAG: tyrosine-type recombinase/integrase [Blastocatellia bacterium]|nr:tyrosine-type recombinase/integrase [Blastocatellia bacterium]